MNITVDKRLVEFMRPGTELERSQHLSETVGLELDASEHDFLKRVQAYHDDVMVPLADTLRKGDVVVIFAQSLIIAHLVEKQLGDIIETQYDGSKKWSLVRMT
jgi:hypothetical protein